MISNEVKTKKKIIIIDDDMFILRSIEKQLHSEDLDIELVNDPLDGLERLKKEKYALAICDIRMRPLTGLEVLNRIKSNYPNLPVIIMTGFVDDGIMEKAKEIGYDDYLIKPFRKSILTESIHRLLKLN